MSAAAPTGSDDQQREPVDPAAAWAWARGRAIRTCVRGKQKRPPRASASDLTRDLDRAVRLAVEGHRGDRARLDAEVIHCARWKVAMGCDG
jgi:hypothetical protein